MADHKTDTLSLGGGGSGNSSSRLRRRARMCSPDSGQPKAVPVASQLTPSECNLFTGGAINSRDGCTIATVINCNSIEGPYIYPNVPSDSPNASEASPGVTIDKNTFYDPATAQLTSPSTGG